MIKSKGNLLIIDDEIEVLNTLNRVFHKDYDIHTTNSSIDAFRILESSNIGVILCCQLIHEMKGTEFFSKIKDLYPDTMIILITGYSESYDVIKSFNKDHIFRYISKPLNLIDLENSVMEAFEKNALIRENHMMVETLKETVKKLVIANEKLVFYNEEKLELLEILDFANKDLKIECDSLRNIIEGTNLGTWEWNIQTGETVFNERWAQIIGYTLEEISPVSIETWTSFVHPEDLKKSEAQLKQVFVRNLDYYDIELRMKHKDGSIVWIQDRAKVVLWVDDGAPLLMSGTHNDITARKRVEYLLFESEKSLKGAQSIVRWVVGVGI